MYGGGGGGGGGMCVFNSQQTTHHSMYGGGGGGACVELQNIPLKFHTIYHTHMQFLYNVDNLRALRFTSSYTLLKRYGVKWFVCSKWNRSVLSPTVFRPFAKFL